MTGPAEKKAEDPELYKLSVYIPRALKRRMDRERILQGSTIQDIAAEAIRARYRRHKAAAETPAETPA